MKVVKLSFYIVIFLTSYGCSVEDLKTDKSQNSKEVSKCVELFTIAPVNEAIVTNANGSLATFEGNGTYCFSDSIDLPLLAKATPETYVDVDYDNQKSATDIKAMSLLEANGIKSFCSNVINLLTNVYYDNYKDKNVSQVDYKDLVKHNYNIDLCSKIANNSKYAKVNFGIYNKTVDNSKFITELSEAQDEISKVENFFSLYLAGIDKKIEYYSAIDSLIKIDQSKAIRADTIHKPKNITVLNSKELQNGKNMIVNSSFDVFDTAILEQENTIYLAVGHDKFAAIAKDTFQTKAITGSKVSIEDFGSRIYVQNYNGNKCGFLVNSNEINIYNLISKSNLSEFDGYYNDKLEHLKFGTKILNVNGYVSLGEKKRLLGVMTDDKGYYLINMENSFKSNCEPNEKKIQASVNGVNEDITITDIDETRDFLIVDGADSAYDAAFRDDGSYLYVAYGDKGIGGFDTQFLDKDYITNSKKSFSLNSGTKAYSLKLFDNDNELIVATDKGFEIYNVEDSNELSFVAAYSTEGAKADYIPQIEIYENYLFFTDGYKGLKVFRLDRSYEPMMCGLAYFAPNNDPYKLAKVEDVNYYKYNDDVYIVVGVSSYGVAKFKLKDILFEHCK